MFTLAISCLTTSNLPLFMDLTFQVPMQYCSLQHWTYVPSPGTFLSLGVVSFHSFWSYFPSLLQEHIGHLLTWGWFIFQCPIFLPFHTVHGVLKAKILKWFAIPFSSGPHFVRTLHHDPSILHALFIVGDWNAKV